jgi:hypothetical protein
VNGFSSMQVPQKAFGAQTADLNPNGEGHEPDDELAKPKTVESIRLGKASKSQSILLESSMIMLD